MRHIIPILIILVTWPALSGQERKGGKITYITSQHVYVNIGEMEHLAQGDTLYSLQGGKEVAALRIKNLSSISAACVPLLKDGYKVTDVVFAKSNTEIPIEISKVPVTAISDPDPGKGTPEDTSAQEINGRLSVSSYSNFSNDGNARNQRMRYTFSLDANNLGNSKLSAESYISFAHNNTNWEEVKENIFNGLKIYNLSLSYAFDETMQLSFGRKINPKL
jgi:hypothetical protein